MKNCMNCENHLSHDILYNRNGFVDSETEFCGCTEIENITDEYEAEECKLYSEI